MSAPKISVLLPVYNGQKYLNKAIDSILNQTYSDFELLIGINGCTDCSLDICKSYVDDRITVFDYGSDKGACKTLNKLLKEAKADWIANQDQDDIWLHEKFEKQIEYINDYDIIGTQICYIDETDAITSKLFLSPFYDEIYYKSLYLSQNQIANSSTLVRKTKLIECGGWDETLPNAMDFDMWLKLMIFHNCKVVNLEDYLVHHRLHKESNFNTQTFDPALITEKYSQYR